MTATGRDLLRLPAAIGLVATLGGFSPTSAAGAPTCDDVERDRWGQLVTFVVGHDDGRNDAPPNFRVLRWYSDRRGGQTQVPVDVKKRGDICEGDEMSTWIDTEVQVRSDDQNFTMWIEGDSQVVFENGCIRQRRGSATYATSDDSSTPICIGESDVQLGRRSSTFRIEVDDPATGTAWVTVLDTEDLFGERVAGATHEVVITNTADSEEVLVRGGETKRVGAESARVFGIQEKQTGEAGEAARASRAAEKARELIAESLVQAPMQPMPPAPRELYPVRLVLQDVASADAIYLDGALLRPQEWRPGPFSDEAPVAAGTWLPLTRRWGAGKALVARKALHLEVGQHELAVQTRGETYPHSFVVAEDHDGRPQVVSVPREHVRVVDRLTARRSFGERYVHTDRVALSVSAALSQRVLYVSSIVEPNVSWAFTSQRSYVPEVNASARWRFHGGRLWLHTAHSLGYFAGNEPEYAGAATWRVRSEILAGVSGGNMLAVSAAMGVRGRPTYQVDRREVISLYRYSVAPLARGEMVWGHRTKIGFRAAGSVGVMTPSKPPGLERDDQATNEEEERKTSTTMLVSSWQLGPLVQYRVGPVVPFVASSYEQELLLGGAIPPSETCSIIACRPNQAGAEVGQTYLEVGVGWSW